MARTKQTARQITETKAPREGLAEVAHRHKAIRGKSLPGQAWKGIRVPVKRRRYLYKSEKTALKENRRHQSSELVLRKLPFAQLVKQISADIRADMRWEASAIEALQEACETMLVSEFELTNLAAIAARRITIQPRDMEFIQQYRLIMTGSKIPGGRAD